jgi:histidinol-phosphate aminotransferase
MTPPTPTRPTTTVPQEPYRRPAPPRSGSLRLDGNEGARPDGEALLHLGSAHPSLLREYPDVFPLQERVAALHGVGVDRVVIGAGADDVMDRCFRAYLGPGRRLLVPVPTFEMVYRFAEVAGATVDTAPWDDAFPLRDLLAHIDERTGVIVVVSPNNPTGQTASLEDVMALSDAAPHALVLLDHVYVEYADVDLTAAALERDNIIVLRTFSKAWGLAGCRVGYGLAAPDVATTLRNAGNPYPVSAMSLAVVTHRLTTEGADLESHVTQVRSERERLMALLRSHDVPAPESQGNFVFAWFGNRAHFVNDALRWHGVVVRHFPHRAGIAGGLRISLPGAEEDFQRLVSALEACLSPDALIFDLDGVLADVEQSYRACIAATAGAFGCEITRNDIEQAIHAGDANNDWIVTQRLLATRGIAVTLDEVTARYQSLYLGDGDAPGLRDTERALLSPEVLARWADNLPVAIVTGRPRAEAEWFVRRAGYEPMISTMVCMEDGPVKPDPAPVRRALQRLGAKRAWMMGDTPDDIRAANAAGVMPIGVVAPGDREDRARDSLTATGAVAVLSSIAELERLLP